MSLEGERRRRRLVFQRAFRRGTEVQAEKDQGRIEQYREEIDVLKDMYEKTLQRYEGACQKYEASLFAVRTIAEQQHKSERRRRYYPLDPAPCFEVG